MWTAIDGRNCRRVKAVLPLAAGVMVRAHRRLSGPDHRNSPKKLTPAGFFFLGGGWGAQKKKKKFCDAAQSR